MSQDVAPQSWWAGVDAINSRQNTTDGRGHNQFKSATAAGTEEARMPVNQQAQQQYAGIRDPRAMFGDLPNSSLDVNLLGDPIRRELELHSAAINTVQRRPSAKNRKGRSLSETRRVSVNTAATAAATVEIADVAGFWKEECRRLQRRLSSLDDERDTMWVLHHVTSSVASFKYLFCYFLSVTSTGHHVEQDAACFLR